jgi:hypothetical protein
MVGMCLRQAQKVVPVTSQEHTPTVVSKVEHSFVGRLFRKTMAQELDFVAELFE